MVRKAVKAELAVESSQLMRNEELNPWMMVALTESWYQVKQEDDQRKSNVQQVSPKSTDFLRRIIPPVDGQGGITLSYVCPSKATDTRLKVTSGGFRCGTVTAPRAGGCTVPGGARHAAASTTGETRTDSGLYTTVRIPARRRCFGLAHHRRVRARISLVLSNCWSICKWAGTKWWTRSSKVSGSRAG